MLIAISATADNQRGPQYMEQALAAIHQANHRRVPISFCFGQFRDTATLLCRFPNRLAAVVEGQIGAHYPNVTIERIPDETSQPRQQPQASQTWCADLWLHPDIFPIRRYSQFEDPINRNTTDPMGGILAALNTRRNDVIRPLVEIIARPAWPRRVKWARKVLRHLASPFYRCHPTLARRYVAAATSRFRLPRPIAGAFGFFVRLREEPTPTPQLATSPGRTHDREEDLVAASDKLGRHLFEVHIRLAVSAPPGQEDRARGRLLQLVGAFGQFAMPRTATFAVGGIRKRCAVGPPRGRGFLLSAEELATLWHPATSTVRAPAMRVTESRELEPPVTLPTRTDGGEIALLGRVKFRSRREVFGIRPDDRRRHLAIIGKTGMGKTTLLQKLIASDIQAGRGCALIDPHGDLADSVLQAIPAHRTNEVVLFDAGDRDYPLSFNLLACRDPNQRPLVASGIVAAFKKLYGESWGPRLEHILRNGLLALLEFPGVSLLSLQRLLSDLHYRKSLTARIADPVVRAFWQDEFAHWKPQFRAEAVAPIQNKVGQFLSQPILRAILGQARSTLDLRRVMDEGRVLVVNLSKGRIGDDASALLGSLLITGIQLAAMSRADVPESHRRDFFLYVDEFQNFATESFATILSEARKYRLNLTLANQYLAQMDEATMAAVFGNVGSLLVFQVGAADAELLAEQLAGDVTPRDLIALPRYTACLRLLIDGMPSRPFSIETLPPPQNTDGEARSAIVRRVSRRRYARPAGQVEAEVKAAFAR
jgi:hypothetical protein